jgi:hypothetical protein
MTNIFIDIPILLKHQSQVVKCVFLGYHLTIKCNTSSYVVALESHFMYKTELRYCSKKGVSLGSCYTKKPSGLQICEP